MLFFLGMFVDQSCFYLKLKTFLFSQPTEIANEIKDFGQSTSRVFESLHTSSKADLVGSQVDELKEKLYKITSMIGDLSNNNDDIDQLGDMVEKELSGMDKAIEEVILICLNFRLSLKIFKYSRLLKKSLIC